MSYKLGAKYIKKNEGYRDLIYKDSLGNLTSGWGHYLRNGSKVPKIVSHIFFKMDYAKARREYKLLELTLDSIRKIVIIDLLFNMGIEKVKKFRRMLAALKVQDFELAGDELKDSLYYRQAGIRARNNINILRTGDLV